MDRTNRASEYRAEFRSPHRRYLVANPPHFTLCQSSPWIVTTTGIPNNLGINAMAPGPSA